jgi:hypothetical protein
VGAIFHRSSAAEFLRVTVAGFEGGVGAVAVLPGDHETCDNVSSTTRTCEYPSSSFPPGTVVLLQATATAESTFVGWTGACSGASPTCELRLEGDVEVGAVYEGPRIVSLSVAGIEGGGGTVLVSGERLSSSCENSGATTRTCRYAVRRGSPVLLSADPRRESVFAGWAGACSGNGPTCELTVSDHLEVGALFEGPRILTLSVAGLQSGFGTVLVSAEGFTAACGNSGATTRSCRYAFPRGTPVLLSAAPGPHTRFGGWAGSCSGSDPTCALTVSDHLEVGALFAGP